MFVFEVVVLFKFIPLIKRLLEHQHWLLLETEFTVVKIMVFIQMILESLLSGKLFDYILFVFTNLAHVPQMLLNELLACNILKQ